MCSEQSEVDTSEREPDMKRVKVSDSGEAEVNGQDNEISTAGGNAASNADLMKSIPPAITGVQSSRRKIYRTVNHFCVPVTTDPSAELIAGAGSFPFLNSRFLGVPWKSSNMYMSRQELYDLQTRCSKWKPLRCAVEFSNFSTHTGNLTGTGTGAAKIQMNYSGVMYESIQGTPDDLGPAIINFANDAIAATHKQTSDAFSRIGRPINVSSYEFGLLQSPLQDGIYTNIATPTTPTKYDQIKYVSWNERSHLQMQNPYHTKLQVELKEDWISPYQMQQPYDRGAATGFPPNGINGIGTVASDGMPNYFRGQYAFNKSAVTQGFNICTKPLNSFMSTNRDGAIVPVGTTTADLTAYTRNGLQPAALYKTPEIWGWRVVPPPTIDGGDPNIMVQFTVEAELEVEYCDMMDEGAEKYYYAYKLSSAATLPALNDLPFADPCVQIGAGNVPALYVHWEDAHKWAQQKLMKDGASLTSSDVANQAIRTPYAQHRKNVGKSSNWSANVEPPSGLGIAANFSNQIYNANSSHLTGYRDV